MEKEELIDAIKFSDALQNMILENFRDLLRFLSKFSRIYQIEEKKLPYHINIIDELHADENAYSCIFAQILRYKEKNKYPFFAKFLRELCKFNLRNNSPKIEKVDSFGRIDIPIIDTEYAVIIENKITDKAPDQNHSNGGQLARYIEEMEYRSGMRPENIFVVYTPRYPRDPSDESWKKGRKSYKEDFKKRFCSLSYRFDIYPWLKDKILPCIDKSNEYLYTAVMQYIDHLEGIFNLRAINKKMNMKLQDFIKDELNLSEDKPEAALKILNEKYDELNNAISQIQLLEEKYQKLFVKAKFQEWETLLSKDFPDLKIVIGEIITDAIYAQVKVEFSLDNREYFAIIESIDYDEKELSIGIVKSDEDEWEIKPPETLQSILYDQKLINDEKEVGKNYSGPWYGGRNTTLISGYSDLKALISCIKKNSGIFVAN